MKTLYIECNMGAAGDMLTAALSELLDAPERFVAQMNDAGIPGMRMVREEKISCGVRGTHISVTLDGEEEISEDVDASETLSKSAPEHHHEHHHEHEHEHDHEHGHDHDHEHAHHHAGLAEVEAIVRGLKLPGAVQTDVLGVYRLIAEAEAYAHGTEIEQIHFHEVGMLDAITDVSAVCLLMHEIAPERVVVSPVCTGFGQVRCMHGIVPVPAPATAYLLRGMPAYAGNLRAELLTPTGAALLKYFADSFGTMPEMRMERVGCGMGMKNFGTANCVRAMLGEAEARADDVVEISCNLDDMTAEAIGGAVDVLLEKGALDVYLTPIYMKKNRPGTMLTLLCTPERADEFSRLMLRHTTTLGVRMARMARRTLRRGSETVETPYGSVAIKTAEGYGTQKCKPEYESAARAARSSGVPVMEVQRAAIRAAEDMRRKD